MTGGQIGQLALALALALLLAAGGMRPAAVAGATSPGHVIAWGSTLFGESAEPGDLEDAIDVTGGVGFSLALRADGSIVGWGRNDMDQRTIPDGLTGVTDLDAGYYHTLALKSNGTVVAWGRSTGGITAVPEGLNDAVAISGGLYHSLVLRANGTVIGWGDNVANQRTIPPGLTGVTAIAAGTLHSLALKSDGTVVGWGADDKGQISIPQGLSGVAAIAAGDDFSLALKRDGTVVGWGADNQGQASVPTGLTGVVAIAAGSEHSLALKADGTLVGWGRPDQGRTVAPAEATNIMAIDAGPEHSLAIVPPSAQSQTISFAPLAGKTYGDLPFAVGATGGQSGNPVTFGTTTPTVCTSGGTHGATITIRGAGDCTVAANQAAGNGYDAAPQRTRTFRVATATLTVTADDASRDYGAANPAFTASVGGFVNGDTPAALGGTLACSTTATKSSPASLPTYPITCAGLTSTNYAIAYRPGALTVNKIPLFVVGGDVQRPYGAANPAFGVREYIGFADGDGPANLGGTLSCTTIATPDSPASGSPYAIDCSGLTSPNYAIYYQPGTLTITRVPLTATVASASRAYGAADPAFSASFAGFVNGDDAGDLGGTLSCTTTATATSPASGSPYAIDCGGLTSGGYAIAYQPGALTITPASLTIVADSTARAYGAPDPQFTVTYSGLVNNEGPADLAGTLTCTTTATASSPASPPTYPITCAGLASTNYTIGYRPGSLTITPAPLTIAATSKTRPYGLANPPLTASFAGFVNGDDQGDLAGTLVCTTTADRASPPSPPTYPITCAGLSSTNYAIAYRSGALTVGDGVTLTVTTGGPGGVTVGPAGVPLGGGATRHAPGTVATLIPQPRGDALFLGWTVNGTPTGWADPLTVTLDADATIAATFVARPTFGDVPVAHSSWEAITQLAARGVIKGYGTNPPTFGPADTLTRGQLAALIVRALDWDTTGVSVASFPDLGGQDPELARAILYLARRGVLKGYADGSFGPDDPLTHYQLVLAISRALVADGRWTRAAADDPNFYPNVALAPEDRLYLATYVRNVGSIPGRPASAAWADWDTPASRAWTAQVLWQALDAAFGRDTTP